MRKNKKLIITLLTCLSIFSILSGVYVYTFQNNYDSNYPIIEYDDSSKLQYMAKIMLEKYLEKYQLTVDNKNTIGEKINYHTYKSSQLVAGNSELFAISTIFEMEPYDKNNCKKLSKENLVDNNGIIHCDWTFIIRNVEENKYQLLDVLQTSYVKETLNISEENSDFIEPVVNTNACDYKIDGSNLYVTYDNWENYMKVPMDSSRLDNKVDKNIKPDKLLEGGYYISKEKTAFMYDSGSIISTNDMGETWETVKLESNIQSLRREFIGFTDDGFGYVAIAGDKAMNFELIEVYTSPDYGHTWFYKAPVKEDGSSMITGISFSTNNIGFITTQSNNIYMTTDGAVTWEIIDSPMPDDLKAIYNTPEAPIFTNAQGEWYFGQGDNADYGAGGNQMCRLISEDGGLTWKYDKEVVK